MQATPEPQLICTPRTRSPQEEAKAEASRTKETVLMKQYPHLKPSRNPHMAKEEPVFCGLVLLLVSSTSQLRLHFDNLHTFSLFHVRVHVGLGKINLETTGRPAKRFNKFLPSTPNHNKSLCVSSFVLPAGLSNPHGHHHPGSPTALHSSTLFF